MDLDWAFQLKDGVPQLSRQALIPGGSVELTHENLFGDSQSLSVSLSSSDWRNPAADLGFQMSFTEPFYAKNTTRNVQVCARARCACGCSWTVVTGAAACTVCHTCHAATPAPHTHTRPWAHAHIALDNNTTGVQHAQDVARVHAWR
jgi:hypothetical protein